MTHDPARAFPRVSSLLLACGVLLACGGSSPTEVLSVSLSNVDTFEYSTVGGDEEGARVITRPQHAEISEIRRGPETKWVAAYVYRPVAGYVGSDVVELESLRNSDGVSPPDVRRLTIEFTVHK